MTTLITLQRLLNESLKEHAVLGEEIAALREALALVPAANGEDAPRKLAVVHGRATAPVKLTRQEMLRKLIRDAGREGLTRTEIIERMASCCDSSSGSISGMLSLLARKRQIVSAERGRWRVKYAR